MNNAVAVIREVMWQLYMLSIIFQTIYSNKNGTYIKIKLKNIMRSNYDATQIIKMFIKLLFTSYIYRVQIVLLLRN